MTDTQVEQILQHLPEDERVIITKNLKKKRLPPKKPKYKKVGYVERVLINSAIGKIEVVEHRVLVSLLYLLAGRISEVLALKKENFHIEEKFMVVKNMWNRKNLEDPRKTLAIPKADSLVPPIMGYLETLPGPKAFLFPRRYTCYGYPYRTDYSEQMSARNALRIVKQHIHVPKIDRVFTHMWRHWRLSHLAVDDGLSSWQLQGVSGHKSAASLSAYVKSNPYKIGELISAG